MFKNRLKHHYLANSLRIWFGTEFDVKRHILLKIFFDVLFNEFSSLSHYACTLSFTEHLQPLDIFVIRSFRIQWLFVNLIDLFIGLTSENELHLDLSVSCRVSWRAKRQGTSAIWKMLWMRFFINAVFLFWWSIDGLLFLFLFAWCTTSTCD